MEMSNDGVGEIKRLGRVCMYVYRTLLQAQRKERKHTHTRVYNYISFPFSMVAPKTVSLILSPAQKSLHRKAAAANCRLGREKKKDL